MSYAFEPSPREKGEKEMSIETTGDHLRELMTTMYPDVDDGSDDVVQVVQHVFRSTGATHRLSETFRRGDTDQLEGQRSVEKWLIRL